MSSILSSSIDWTSFESDSSHDVSMTDKPRFLIALCGSTNFSYDFFQVSWERYPPKPCERFVPTILKGDFATLDISATTLCLTAPLSVFLDETMRFTYEATASWVGLMTSSKPRRA